jgi:hypothetical protein
VIEETGVATAVPMSLLGRRAGACCVSAAALVVLSQVMRLGVGLLLGADSASTVAHTLTYAMALLGMCALLLALTALSTRAHPPLWADSVGWASS